LKQYEILVSEVVFKFDKFSFDNFDLIPFRDNSHTVAPQAILLVYETSETKFHNYRGDYVSSLLSFIFRRRINLCHFVGKPYPPIDYPIDGKISRIPTPCWERFGHSVSYANYELHNEFSPDDEIPRLKLLGKLHSKIQSFSEKEKETIFNSLYLHRLAYIVRPEDIELAFALLVGSIEAIADQDTLFDFNKETNWSGYGSKKQWDEFFRKEGIDEAVAVKTRDNLLKMDPQLTTRFRKFIEKYLPESFWTTPDPDVVSAYNFEHWLEMGGHWDEIIKFAPEHKKNEYREIRNEHLKASFNSEVPIKERLWFLTEKGPYYNVPPFEKKDLIHILNNAYKSRSRFFHAGKPFEIDIRGVGFGEAKTKIDFSKWTINIPTKEPKTNIHADFKLFERIVRDCILSCVEQKV
jgi:hypothetical protein